MIDPRPPSRTELLSLLRSRGIQPSRALGQNFLVDANMAGHIAKLAGVGPGTRVLEIGAGVGSLTGALAASGATVTALEIDRRLLPLLAERVEPMGVTVLEADAMAMDFGILPDDGEAWHVVANLPYNVATPLVLRLLEDAPQVKSVVAMVQAEVAERLVAVTGSKAYGAVSVRVSYFATGRVLTRVGPDVFLPRPNVASSVVRLARRSVAAEVAGDPAGEEGMAECMPEYRQLVRLVRAGFGHRRKMLRRSLGELVAPDQMEQCGISWELRAEDLDLQAWRRLARVTMAEASS